MNYTRTIFILIALIAINIFNLYGADCYILHKDKKEYLKPNYINLAKQKFDYLKNYNYFDFDLTINREWQCWALNQENYRRVTIETKDDVIIKGYFLDRNSDKVLLIGQGFLSPKEALIPFFKLFPDYDILIIDYRWKEWHKKSILRRLNTLVGTLRKYIYDAKNEVIAAVKFLRRQKRYKTVSGIGQCYSGLIYTIAQVITYEREGTNLFDNIIIDSGFYSTKSLIQRVVADPKLCWENKYGGTPRPLKWITNNWAILNLFAGAGRIWLGKNFMELSMQTYLPRLKQTKLLYIHGQKDLIIPFDDFELMYKATNSTDFAALITPNEHTTNHLKAKEIYAYTINQFIESESVKNFVNKITTAS